MTEEGTKRKLTALLSADVKGYSRIMGEDEKATIETLKTYREVMETLIHHYKGRVIDAPGDNVLSQFASVVDAVECAIPSGPSIEIKRLGLMYVLACLQNSMLYKIKPLGVTGLNRFTMIIWLMSSVFLLASILGVMRFLI